MLLFLRLKFAICFKLNLSLESVFHTDCVLHLHMWRDLCSGSVFIDNIGLISITVALDDQYRLLSVNIGGSQCFKWSSS